MSFVPSTVPVTEGKKGELADLPITAELPPAPSGIVTPASFAGCPGVRLRPSTGGQPVSATALPRPPTGS